MFTTAGDGHAPGDTEILEATNGPDGIHFTVKSLSPIAIGWKAGDLTVTVTDSGESADPMRQWHFRVELDDQTISGEYGDMRFTDGVAAFTLQSGQSLTARALPEGVKYTVTELEANQDGYTTTCTDEKGLTVSGETITAVFTNVFAKTEPEDPNDPGTSGKPTDSAPSEDPGTSERPQNPTVRPSSGGPNDQPSGTPNDTPKTGDASQLSLWLALMLLSLAGAGATALSPIKSRKRPAGAREANDRK